MKKTRMIVLCLLVVIATSLSVKAQEVTITIMPGWTWISIPSTDTLDFATALGTFTPAAGDIVRSQHGSATYLGNGQWRGSISQFFPGCGYKYYSNRTTSATVTFNVQQPAPQLMVTTAEPTDITTNSATCGGDVASSDGNYVFVILRGVCWSTTPNPSFNENYIEVGNGLGSFTGSLTELNDGTTYYVRAFAITENGTFYGNEVSFVTLDIPSGAVNGLFSVSETQQVCFSQGNLQYIGSAALPYWKFADNQWDYLGTTTGQNSTAQNVDRDLFGWGTSGWSPGNTYYHPWDTYNASGSSYGPAGSNNLTDQYANADWGVYNPISNGGNLPNQWRTLTKNEWKYVFDIRSTASGIRYVKAKVNNVNGVILLPDDWNASYYNLSDENVTDVSYSVNTITVSEWGALEQHGAVFLPAAGHRFGTSVMSVGDNGYYWSSSYVNSTYAYGVYFTDSNLNSQDCSNRTYGRSVRLVHVVE